MIRPFKSQPTKCNSLLSATENTKNHITAFQIERQMTAEYFNVNHELSKLRRELIMCT